MNEWMDAIGSKSPYNRWKKILRTKRKGSWVLINNLAMSLVLVALPSDSGVSTAIMPVPVSLVSGQKTLLSNQ